MTMDHSQFHGVPRIRVIRKYRFLPFLTGVVISWAPVTLPLSTTFKSKNRDLVTAVGAGISLKMQS